METPDTVTQAVELLRAEGYVDDFELCADGLLCGSETDPHGVDDARVDYTFRFEGPSDPGDEAIVLGLSCPSWNRKGVVVSAYGPDADPEDARLLRRLAASARDR